MTETTPTPDGPEDLACQANRAKQEVVTARAQAPRDDHGSGLVRFHVLCEHIVGIDARARLNEIESAFSSTNNDADYLPSVHEIMDVQIIDETRHSLFLAWLLDPTRSRKIAAPLWAALIDHLTETAETPEQRTALETWSPDFVSFLKVDPKAHKKEWEYLDVFARAVRGGRHLFGLVVENKVSEMTQEQPNQLERYFQRVVEEGHSPASTVFVFLTESRRKPATAGSTEPHWQRLSWVEVAGILKELSQERSGLDRRFRRLLAQYRNVVVRDILGVQTDYQRQEAAGHLYSRLPGEDRSDSDLRRSHSSICMAWSKLKEMRDGDI